jgi:hypothetical protein
MDYYYQVVQVDAEGAFLDKPKQFYKAQETIEHFQKMCKNHPDLEFAVFECRAITSSCRPAEKSS